MMRWIVATSLKFRLLVLAAAAGLLLFGVISVRSMPVGGLPEFTPPTVEIQTEALGLSAVEVEQLITVPMEQDLLNGLPWLQAIRSESVPGLASIQLIFEPGTDLLNARQVVQERLPQAGALPNVSKPPLMLQPTSSTSRVMMVRLSSARLTPIEMSVLARWTIRPRLMGVPGVASVAIWGQRERQLQVQVDPRRLRALGITLPQVVETTGNALWVSPLSFLEASTPGTGGFFDTANQRLAIQHLSPITTAADLARVTVEEHKGRALRLGDVARVVEDHQPLIGDTVFPGNPSGGLLLVVEKLPGANAVQVTNGVETALSALKPGLSGMQIDTNVYRPATYLETTSRNLGIALLVALGLIVVVLGVFLFEWRGTLIAAASIVLSLMVALLVLRLTGRPLNMMLLAGLVMALGVVVDDAVIDAEKAGRDLRRPAADGGRRPAFGAILDAALEMRGPVVYATLIILVALIPLFLLKGESGAFLPPIAISYGLAILASMLVALTLTPALTLLLAARGARLARPEPPLARWLERLYERSFGWIAGRRWLAFAAAAVVVVAGLSMLPLLSRSLVPTFRDSDLLINVDAQAGTSLPETGRVTARLVSELRTLPGIASVGAHVGRAVSSDEVADVNSAQVWVTVDAKADYGSTIAAVQRVASGYPGLNTDVQSYPNSAIADVLSGGEEPVVVRVFGEDLGVLDKVAGQVKQTISGVTGVSEPTVDSQVMQPTLEIQVDLNAARRHGIKPGDVRRAAATLLSGTLVGNLFEQQKVFDVVVWGTPDTRRSVSSVGDLLIDTPGGGYVKLRDVARVSVRPDPDVIRHQAVSRYVDVHADVRGRSVSAVTADVKSKLATMSFPLEYHAEVLGGFAERQAAQWQAMTVAVAAAIVIFLLLQAALGGWRLAAVLFVALPLSLAGGLLAALAAGGVVSLGSVAGFFAVFGLAARWSLTMIARWRRLVDDGEEFGLALILRGARERIVPIVITALATAIALVPVAVVGAVPGYEIVHPMAVVILGGVVTAALFCIFVLPFIYLRLGAGLKADPGVALLASAAHGEDPAETSAPRQ